MVASPKRAEKREPNEHTDEGYVLYLLRAGKGQWVADLYQDARCMVHSRVAGLRRRGYQIECKCFGVGDWRYRLVKEKA